MFLNLADRRNLSSGSKMLFIDVLNDLYTAILCWAS
jgi:hypothetical protein